MLSLDDFKAFNELGIKPETPETTTLGTVYKNWYKPSGYYFVASIEELSNIDWNSQEVFNDIMGDNNIDKELEKLLDLSDKRELYRSKTSPALLELNSDNKYTKVVMGKIVPVYGLEQREPCYEYNRDFISVGGYIYDEVEKYFEKNRVEYDDDYINNNKMYHTMNIFYHDDGEFMFDNHQDMHFCSVIFDRYRNIFVAGVTTPIDDWTHLYYGDMANKPGKMYSNSRELLERLSCKNINEMPNNTYMVNGKFFKAENTLTLKRQLHN